MNYVVPPPLFMIVCPRCNVPALLLGPPPQFLRCPCGEVLVDRRPPDPLGGETLVLPPERPGC
ncbi:MAG: hypothetical protein V4597_11560 [Pseudomonadota bacterium]